MATGGGKSGRKWNHFNYFVNTYKYTHTHTYIHTVIIVGLSSMSYRVIEDPNAVATVCATIQLGSVGRDVAVLLFTPVTGSVITGMYIRMKSSLRFT